MIQKLISLLIVVQCFACCQQPAKTTVFLAGDSTMSEKKIEKYPETGWGMKLQPFFDQTVEVVNHAKNGRSTRTFIEEGRWDSLIGMVQPKDYVFIQFGHNDQSKHKTDRYTSPHDYRKNLVRFVNDIHRKKGQAVLLTPVVRRRFRNGEFYDVHGVYPSIVREVSDSMNVPLLDMHLASEKLLIELGEEKSKALFLIAESGLLENYPDGVNDNTHFSEEGACQMAELAAKLIGTSPLDIRKHLNK